MSAARRSRDETKQLMIEAGSEVLLRDGIGMGASTIRYPDVFALLAEEHGIKVTRGSVHGRLWSSQLAWQLDVLSEDVRRTQATRRQAVAVAITERLAALPIETIEERTHVFWEAARVGSLVFIEQGLANPDHRLFPTLVAAWKASADDLPEHDRLGEILRALQADASAKLIDDITTLTNYLQLRANPAHGLTLTEAIRAYCATTLALGYGQTIRLEHDPALSEVLQVRSPNGDSLPWNFFGLANLLLARSLFRDRGRAS